MRGRKPKPLDRGRFLSEAISLLHQIQGGGRFYAFYNFSGHVDNFSCHITPIDDPCAWLYEEYVYLCDEFWPTQEGRRMAMLGRLAEFLDPATNAVPAAEGAAP